MVTPHPWIFHANRSSHFLVILLTKKQRKKDTYIQTQKSIENNTPSPYRGQGNKTFIISSLCLCVQLFSKCSDQASWILLLLGWSSCNVRCLLWQGKYSSSHLAVWLASCAELSTHSVHIVYQRCLVALRAVLDFCVPSLLVVTRNVFYRCSVTWA